MACVNIEYIDDDDVFVRSNLSSLNIIGNPYDRRDITELFCDNLEFDYSEAPELGLIAQHLAVEDNKSSKKFNVYPNPSDGIFNISFNSVLQDFSISVYNVLGNEIYSGKVNNANEKWNGKIDLSGNASGFYFMKICNANNFIVDRLILR